MLVTALDLQQTRNEKQLSCVPYLCLLVNCIVWTIYATMKGFFALFLPNAIGVFIGFYCTLLYHQYSRIEIPSQNLALSSAVIMLSIILGAAGSVASVGLLAVIMSSLVYASPLATIATVIREKSTESMPFHTSMLVWLGAAFWTLYGGLVAHDIAVLIPSLAGLIMASIQLFMYVLYGFPPQHLASASMDRRTFAPASADQQGTGASVQYKPVLLEPNEKDPMFPGLRSYQQQV
jgi:uncharacterized protein with PQ loop repeat